MCYQLGASPIKWFTVRGAKGDAPSTPATSSLLKKGIAKKVNPTTIGRMQEICESRSTRGLEICGRASFRRNWMGVSLLRADVGYIMDNIRSAGNTLTRKLHMAAIRNLQTILTNFNRYLAWWWVGRQKCFADRYRP